MAGNGYPGALEQWSPAMPLTAVLAPELGHCLGLSHRNASESSIMFRGEGHKRWSPTLTADHEAVRALYR